MGELEYEGTIMKSGKNRMDLRGDKRCCLYRCSGGTRQKHNMHKKTERERLALRNNAEWENHSRDMRGTPATIDVLGDGVFRPRQSR